jgi:tetratricopeptide (TPR) repeat protein
VSAWEILAIAPTVDVNKIKLAYAALLTQYHPDEDPNGFQKLRFAYETCLEASRRLEHSSKQRKTRPEAMVEPEGPSFEQIRPQAQPAPLPDDHTAFENSDQVVETVMAELKELYQDFHRRIDLGQWQAILDRDILQRIDVNTALNPHLFAFIGEHDYLPGEVCRLLAQRFNWLDQPIELTKLFQDKVLDLVYWRLHFAAFKHDYKGLQQAQKIDFDVYIALREEAAHVLAQNETQKAEALLAEAGTLYGDDPVLHLLLGQVAERRADDESALYHYTRMVEIAPGRLEGYLCRANIFLRQQRVTEAFNDFQYVLAAYGNNLAATKGLARCHQYMENFEEAKLLYELALEKEPSDFEIIIAIELLNEKLIAFFEASDSNALKQTKALVSCYLNVRQSGKAMERLRACPSMDADIYLQMGKAMEQQDAPFQEVEALFQKGLAVAAESGENGYDLQMARGKLLEKADRFADAATAFKAAWEINPHKPGLAQQIAWSLFYADDDHYDEALAWIERAIAISPERYAFQQTKGHILYYANQYEAALKALDIYIDTRYNAPFERYAKGMCHYNLGQFDAAAQSLRMAQKMEREDEHLSLWLCISYYKIGQFDDAYAQIQRYENEGWEKCYIKGKVEAQLGQFDKALASFKAGGDKYGSWDCYAGSAYCYMRLADHERAIATLNGLDRDIPDQPWVLFNLAAVYCLNKQWEACVETADHYIRQCKIDEATMDDSIFYYRAMAFYHMRRLPQAIEAAEKAYTNGKPVRHVNLLLSMLYYEIGQINKSIQHLVGLGPQENSMDFKALIGALMRSAEGDPNQPRVFFVDHFPEIKTIVPPAVNIDALVNDLS